MLLSFSINSIETNPDDHRSIKVDFKAASLSRHPPLILHTGHTAVVVVVVVKVYCCLNSAIIKLGFHLSSDFIISPPAQSQDGCVGR